MTSKRMVMSALGVLLIAGSASSFWYAVLNAVALHVVVAWANLFAYALGLVVGIVLLVWGACDMPMMKKRR